MEQQRIAVLGAGSWGTGLASVLSDNGHDVCMWTIEADLAEQMNVQRENKRYSPGLRLKDNISVTTDLNAALLRAEVILFVVPTKAIREVALKVKDILAQEKLAPPLIVHASKGLEQGSHERISQILKEVLPADSYTGLAILSGPSHAEEVAKKDITTITAASEDLAVAETIQDLFLNDYFRVYTNTDVVGVELGGALKNIIALAAGGVDGLDFGDNTKAALITRGLAEITRFGLSQGADPLTFSGLSGVGDLIVTCNSQHSRNWRAGYQLAQGKKAAEIEAEMGMVVEGIPTTKAVFELAQDLAIDMPITQMLYQIIYKGAEVDASLKSLMQRRGKSEVQLRQALDQYLKNRE